MNEKNWFVLMTDRDGKNPLVQWHRCPPSFVALHRFGRAMWEGMSIEEAQEAKNKWFLQYGAKRPDTMLRVCHLDELLAAQGFKRIPMGEDVWVLTRPEVNELAKRLEAAHLKEDQRHEAEEEKRKRIRNGRILVAATAVIHLALLLASSLGFAVVLLGDGVAQSILLGVLGCICWGFVAWFWWTEGPRAVRWWRGEP